MDKTSESDRVTLTRVESPSSVPSSRQATQGRDRLVFPFLLLLCLLLSSASSERENGISPAFLVLLQDTIPDKPHGTPPPLSDPAEVPQTLLPNLDLSETLQFTQTVLDASGSIFFTGVGKSGFVVRKISQTLVSLSVPSAFLSPVDALHGDIGILSKNDVLVLFSKSGNTEKLLKLVPCVKAKGVFLISITSVKGNLLENVCHLNVHLPLEREFCPFNLAPVTSTAIQMVF
ncbi:hypothetical protein H6P81_016937 [Aristolochia fimbriata]|uniref:SIS domain-containing protein n=1 Tax=Aristolochia fimbriata TaxID=158543 RepID=A0AAV7DWZ3_ARIFI|nr:hypothetical protein H6P81_016937 [Aristolochia fimbriata]